VAVVLGVEVKVTGTPLTALPFASRTTAVICVSWPILSCVVPAVSVMLRTATGGATAETTALAVTPSALALIVTPPALSAVTLPDELTLTMLASVDTQVTVRPVSTFPLASLSVTFAWAD
jgi:hypothetical protein